MEMSGLFLNSKIEILNMSCFCNDLTSNTIPPPLGQNYIRPEFIFKKFSLTNFYKVCRHTLRFLIAYFRFIKNLIIKK